MPTKQITLTAANVDSLAAQEPFKLLAMLENKQTHDHVWQLVSDYGADSAPLCVDCADPVIAETCPCEHKGIDGLVLEVSA